MAKADRMDTEILPTVTPTATISELTSWRPRSPRAIAVSRLASSSLPGVERHRHLKHVGQRVRGGDQRVVERQAAPPRRPRSAAGGRRGRAWGCARSLGVLHAPFEIAELNDRQPDDQDHQDDRLGRRQAEDRGRGSRRNRSCRPGRRSRRRARPRSAMDDAERVEEGLDDVDDEQEEGGRRDQREAMLTKRRSGPAPSIAAASIRERGIACRAARKKTKL